MYKWMILAASIFLRVSAWAESSEAEVLFSDGFEMPVIAAPDNAIAGDVLWESEPSRPALADFAALLLQGQTESLGFSIDVATQTLGGLGVWRPVRLEVYPNGRFWGRIEIAGKAGTLVRVRVRHDGCKPSQRIEIFSLEFNGPRKTEPALKSVVPLEVSPAAYDSSLSRPLTKPAVIPRSEWGAAKPTVAYEPLTTPQIITVHHTEAYQAMSYEHAKEEIRIIQHYHQRGRHWDDIGYHFVIDGSGRIYEGRPITALGAHVAYFNPGNIGIAVMGNFQKMGRRPTQKQIAKLKELVRYLGLLYSIPAKRVFGHKDLDKSRKCPGKALYRYLPEVRAALSRPAPAKTRPVAETLDSVYARFRFD